MSIKGTAHSLLIVLCLCIGARAQLAINIQASGPPVGSCSNSVIYTNSANGDFYNCVVGAWHKVSPSTSGTVSSFSAGALSPLFTTSVATATTTPALSFSLSNAAANTIFGNFTGSSGAPSYNAVGACGDSTHALAWTAGTGFTCQAISAGSGTVSNIATTSPITGGPITTTGTIACATCAIGPGSSTANHLAKFSGTDGVTLADGGAIPAGTVTSIATTSPIGGGTITGSGTLTCTTCVTSAAALTSGQLVAGAGSQAAAVTNLTGDVTTSGGVATTLASVVTAGTCGDTTHSCGLTYNAKGLITAATNNVISGGGGSLPTAGWTVVNSGILNNFSTSITECYITNNPSTLNWRICTQTLPAAPYTVIAQINCLSMNALNTQGCGLYLYDGTKLEGIELLRQNATAGIRVEKLTNVNTDNSTLQALSAVTGNLLTVKIVDDSTHRTFYYYTSGAYTQFFQETSGAYLTPTSVGFGGISIVAGSFIPVMADLLYWSVTSP